MEVVPRVFLTTMMGWGCREEGRGLVATESGDAVAAVGAAGWRGETVGGREGKGKKKKRKEKTKRKYLERGKKKEKNIIILLLIII